MSIFSLYLWNNLEYEVDGKKMTVKESITRIFTSKEMEQLKETLNTLWNFYQAHGFQKLYEQLFIGDSKMISEAYKVIFKYFYVVSLIAFFNILTFKILFYLQNKGDRNERKFVSGRHTPKMPNFIKKMASR
jgi:hypothetical protein